MTNSLNSQLKEATAYIQDFGLMTLIKGSIRRLIQQSKYRYSLLRGHKPSFIYRDKELEFFWHPYNRTWLGERSIEISAARDFLERQNSSSSGLEIGNVLSHYQPTNHKVVDKYERGDGVENKDVLSITTSAPLDWIIAISTLEHVGWDEPEKDFTKAVRSFEFLRSLLKPITGRMFVTIPLGYHPHMDAYILSGIPGVEHEAIYVRDHKDCWSKVAFPEPHQICYLHDLRSAGILWVAELTPL